MALRRLSIAACFGIALALPATAVGGVRYGEREEPLAPARSLVGGARVLPPRTAPFLFDLVGVRWRGPGRVWVRAAGAHGWSAWHDARAEADDLPDRRTTENAARQGWTLGSPYWGRSSRRIQLRLEGEVTRVRSSFVRAVPSRVGRVLAIAGAPPIVSRAGWGADEEIVRAAPAFAPRLALAIVHHTAGSTPASPEESAALVRAIQAYHVKGNGWNDIGYNFLVDPFGQVFEGRGGGVDRNVVGAHAQGFNTGSVGIAVIGSYGSEGITRAAEDALAQLIAWRLDLAHVDPASRLTQTSSGNGRFAGGAEVQLAAVSGHRDTGFTDCPGDALHGQLGEVARLAAAVGLPKLYAPDVSGVVGGPVVFSARLSEPMPWTVTVTDTAGSQVASGSGSGAEISWTWDSSAAAAGAYAYRIDAGPAVLPAIGTVGGAVPFALTGLRALPGAFTPNGDGYEDETTVSFALSAPAAATVTVFDGAGAPLATLASGQSLPAGPATIRWSGSASDGSALPDGRYVVSVSAEAGGKRVSRSAPVVLDRTLGSLSLAPELVSPNGDRRLDEVTVGFDLSRPAAVRIRLLARGKSIARAFTGELQPGSQSVSWAARKRYGRLRDGRYTISVEATTDLGTRTLTHDVVVDTTPPRVEIASVGTRGGATKLRFRLSEPARLKVWLGQSAFTIERAGGVGTFWQRVQAKRVRIVAWDRAGNTGAPVTLSIQPS